MEVSYVQHWSVRQSAPVRSKVNLAPPNQVADVNLRFKILNEFAFAHPVPLVYPRWLGGAEPDLLNVNGEIMSVLDESTCILSFGVGKCQRASGDLEALSKLHPNMLFYRWSKPFPSSLHAYKSL